MAALPTRATVFAGSAQPSAPPSSSSNASSAASSAPSSKSSTPPSKSSRLRAFFGLHSSPPSPSTSDEADDGLGYGDIPPTSFPTYGFLGPHLDVDDHPTPTSTEQLETEARIDAVVEDWKARAATHRTHLTPSLTLLRDIHVGYLLRSLELLPAGYAALDASRPWLVYWTLQALSALHFPIPLPLAHRCLAFLARCQHPSGGYGGGPGQDPHLAPTYASVNALCILSGVQGVGQGAFGQVDRRQLYRFLLRMKQSDGSFSVCDGGECDTRGLYTAISVATMCGLLTERVAHRVVEYLQRCQTYEGGMGGEPGNEAHGGYTFCSLAALLMLGRAQNVRLEGPRSVRQWAARRQMRREGGFCGRTNKLVDGCYSFWVGALFPLLDLCAAANGQAQRQRPSAGSGYDELALQRYILLGGQTLTGGLRDKPGKGPDLYHTCYVLSGLSVAQWGGGVGGVMGAGPVAGGDGNRVRQMNALYNVPIEDAERGLEWAAQQPQPDASWT